LAGCVVTVGAKSTTIVNVFDVAEPTEFVNTARTCSPFCAAVTEVSVSVVEVAPEMFVNVELPAGADCHCTVGVGLPEAAAVQVTVCPTRAGCGEQPGCVVTAGTVLTVSVAAVVVAVPPELVNTARYWLPDSDRLVGDTVSVVEVAPETLVNVVPPSVDTCHCTVGVGVPEAAAVNVAAFGAVTVWFVGLVVTVGGVTTVSVAMLLFVDPPVFVNTARYWVPLIAWVTLATVSVVEVAPEMFVNVLLPDGADCHCTVGDGLPEAVDVKVAV
jgi:hypothetical protein